MRAVNPDAVTHQKLMSAALLRLRMKTPFFAPLTLFTRVDTSGSIDGLLVQLFLAEVLGILSAYPRRSE